MENNETETIYNRKEQKELTTPMAILVAGILIAGSILMGFSWLSHGTGLVNKLEDTTTTTKPSKADTNAPIPVSASDHYLGSETAPVTLVLYADFQCPFCGKFFKEVEESLNTTYVQNGKVTIVYRDFSFLGAESVKAAQAARCAADQNKFWEYHDYLFTHQEGENKGHFSADNLKSFAKNLGLDTTSFNSCLDSDKYAKAVLDSTQEGGKAGVNGTPKGFIIKNGKVLDTIDGAEPLDMVTGKLDKALK